jgi:AraC-like DNA-binding protein
MAEGGTLIFSDPEAYAAAFCDAHLNLTITGAGAFKARLTYLRSKQLEVCCCSESLPRIAYFSLPPDWIFLSFPVGPVSLICDGVALGHGDFALHSRRHHLHQRSSGECQWGLIAISSEQLSSYAKTLIGREMPLSGGDSILSPPRAERLRFRSLFGQACHLVESRKKSIEHSDVAGALEHEMLRAVIDCLATNERDDDCKTRDQHAATMVRFEQALLDHLDQKLKMPSLCAELGVAERTLRLCCAEFLGVSPTRYILLKRLNKARSALRRADPSTTTVAEVARNYQFLELGRFAVTYRTTFGESPSATLQRNRQIQAQAAESA